MTSRPLATLVATIVTIAASLLASAPFTPLRAQDPTGPEVLDRAILYHDPDGAWPTFAGELRLEQSRPDGSVREVRVTLDQPRGRFVYESDDQGTRIRKAAVGDRCEASVNGSTRFSPEQASRYGLSCDQVLRSRNYYLYLWGLPMKLRDPGTRVDPVSREGEFMGMPVRIVRVTYDAEVGTDTWYFYFEPADGRMVGYRFYHDEAANDGEYIVLDGEYELEGMRIPMRRRWYTNAADEFLGEDVLRGHGPPR